ncbi:MULTISPECIES: VOC family protein [unclassified Rhizobium]|uniref:VOC family protein n=1 Tax=unclassified Rhizobium TaxID=2613769 RepID=UPI0021F74DA5|nr:MULTISPECIES: VOC family protein [unclassified Rhizobium]MCV9943968.1 VOC family protein [Rhizobium sp. BT-175]MCW0017533.1 VOC family protein [Rhizobium sp. BT-226]
MDVQEIDHVHVEVRDRDAAAAWYQRILGLMRDERFASWADDPMGPLILATAAGKPVLSLFARELKPVSRDSTVAFRVSGEQFLSFLEELPELGLAHRSGTHLSNKDIVDHGLSWSIYFVDPDENRIEITTYDYEHVATKT